MLAGSIRHLFTPGSLSLDDIINAGTGRVTRVWIQNGLRASPTVNGIISWPFPPVMTGGGLYDLEGLNVFPSATAVCLP